MIQQALDHFITDHGLFDDGFAVLGLNLYILDNLITLLDTDQGSQLTEALAAGLFHANSLLIMMAAAGRKYQLHAVGVLYQLLKDLMDLVGAGSNTAGAGTNQNPAVIIRQVGGCLRTHLGQFRVIFDHHALPLSSAISARALSGFMEG